MYLHEQQREPNTTVSMAVVQHTNVNVYTCGNKYMYIHRYMYIQCVRSPKLLLTPGKHEIVVHASLGQPEIIVQSV